MKRKIVEIDQEKCNGCGLCVNACHEGAIEIRNGKAVLISDEYCDGLGNCLPECPTGAIKIVEREAAEYNHELVMKKMEERKGMAHSNPFSGCPGQRAMTLERNSRENKADEGESAEKTIFSELNQWPVQLNLINPHASYLDGAHLLIAADCCAYAYGNFHKDFIAGKITLIGCPKLDDNEYYIEKLTEIFSVNDIKSITVTRMEVPCCGGIVHAVKTAMLNARKIVPYREVIIGIDGKIVNE
ncbi:4Fe-4S ferredoxin iron-sulfur binding domain-containing protein [Thermoclostridium stercorarium subsp. stercorarium DSM 8532]|uniref:4Fe-4S ferredoxin iron-sulfur binding domain-containing protein n=2 Tax=Thermoclostridium stercorarium TaxID=1510 RepID=L7VMI2_THES1|nr:4Fe-4S binding protein [Thermoclostridium stercorarium]AGC67859.1 4Fe-4S ferredoxin iron-sulfur binding domain-containing protein [Thermoclostridium stercorarium subsp. stercorarium DSM 8532]AGI38900.1 4Fe-4S dicluster domain-containing protein [Thermoclostridium stercorarium subsp. stercorarium DSM 8532]ANW98271.1 (Fe-S)-binding protein [Thermoclostridium stercorarium subsp. thermolacticum DSM 2910]UZQ86409.1 4Fe-4S binding protein [Thermoclostridium stercorarium]